ncbi:MAG: PhzF family phenazine biosynthesis protein [Acidimicrobiales bacterium]
MRPELVQIDAFTDRPFRGNPAAVCALDRAPTEEWMQELAREMNLSETAFLVPVGPTDGEPPRGVAIWSLRWFTPRVEVDLSGHATLAAAHYLFEHRGITAPVLRFLTRSGELTASRGSDGWIELDLPADPTRPADPPHGVIDALGISGQVVDVAAGAQNLVLELASPEQVRAVEPDMTALGQTDAAGVIVTSVGEGLYDLVSRFFAPRLGIPEDPVTGSAHCTLAAYWAPRLGKTELLARQVSARGGELRVVLRGERVTLAGQAVTVFKARLADVSLPPHRRSTTRRSRGAPDDPASP